jgi:prepilin-type N-terminal cleavage/methylation domain-containing protein
MTSPISLTSTRNEAGVTLTELMIVMFLISIIATLMITMLNTTLGVMQDIEWRSGGEAEAQNIVSNLSWEIRSGQKLTVDTPVLAVANPNEITFYRVKTFGGVPTRYHYYLVGDKLTKGYLVGQDAGGTWTFTGVERVAQAGQYVRNNAGLPMFKYYKEDGTQITPLSASDRAMIRKVAISIVCDIKTDQDPPPYTSSIEVRLRNQR